jgi:hypothetical protein
MCFTKDIIMSDLQNEEKPVVLEGLKMRIERLSKHHQIEILAILSKNQCRLNENKSGVYVNLSFLPATVIDEIRQYLSYVNDQEESLLTMEYQKDEFKNAFFVDKEDKDNMIVSYNSISK